MHFQCWSFYRRSQKYGHVPSTRHHLVSCGQLSVFTSGIKQCIFRRYLSVSFRRTYYGHILSNQTLCPSSIITVGCQDSNTGAYSREALGSIPKINFAMVSSHLINCPSSIFNICLLLLILPFCLPICHTHPYQVQAFLLSLLVHL